ncbi:MAG: aminotransferase class V-fold PLP-dependent enzyme [Bdellovibrionales bacterium]|nr:aminotransferase class V-fold PLP-dependent enzyme [Bdellovibrionales bacterium]
MRSLFPANDAIYLNSGSHSLSPSCALEAVQRYRDHYEQNPSAALFDASKEIWSVHEALAQFLHAQPEDVFLRANVTYPLNHFILSAPLSAQRNEILASDLEYGAVLNICRHRVEERKDASLRTFALPSTHREYAGLTATKLAGLVLEQVTSRTGLVVLSHIATATGLVLPIADIARELRRRDVLFIVDGAHAPGALALNFERLQDVDFYVGNLHKWVMGPKGTAFGWVAPQRQKLLPPPHAGWTTFELTPPFTDFGGQSTFSRQYLMPGCHDFAPFYALRETFDFWREQGAEKIRARLYALQSYTEQSVAKHLGWPLASPPAGPLRGPLLSFELPEHLAKREGFSIIRELWQDHRVQILIANLKGRGVLRLSPHIYNTEEQIDRALSIIAKL